MEFITLDDVTDEIVTCNVNDIAEANSYLLNIARRLGADETRLKATPVYTVKRLGVSYALYICCVRSIGKDNLTALDVESTRNDIYAQKARFFKAEIDSIEKKLTAAEFEEVTGGSGGMGSGFCVPVRRG